MIDKGWSTKGGDWGVKVIGATQILLSTKKHLQNQRTTILTFIVDLQRSISTNVKSEMMQFKKNRGSI